MGEAKQRLSATAKMIVEHPKCCLCGGSRPAETREHMPPKAMFDGSHRPDDLVLPACRVCNDATRTADLIVSIISRWRFSASPPGERHDHKRLVNRLRSQAPEVVEEWQTMARTQEEGRRHLGQFIPIPPLAGVVSLGPHTLRALNLFAHKLVLGLYFHILRQPLPSEGRMWAFWKTKEDIAYSGPPDFLLNMLPDYGSLIQGRWNTSDTFAYRTGRDRGEGTFGCCARLRGGLLVGGFAVEDAKAFDTQPLGWTSPDDLLANSRLAHFAKRDL